jgi:hypothetical protein
MSADVAPSAVDGGEWSVLRPDRFIPEGKNTKFLIMNSLHPQFISSRLLVQNIFLNSMLKIRISSIHF